MTNLDGKMEVYSQKGAWLGGRGTLYRPLAHKCYSLANTVIIFAGGNCDSGLPSHMIIT